jgi:general secretion pathway protein C
MNKHMKADVLIKSLIGLFIALLFFFFSTPAPAGPTLQDFPDRAVVGMTLVGVIVSSNAESSMALLNEDGSDQQVMLKVGEKARGFTLLRVDSNRIVLEKNTSKYQLFMNTGALHKLSSGGEKSPEREIPSPPLLSPESGPEPEERTFRRSEVLQRLKDEMPRIMQETRFSPYTKEGQVLGFKLTRIPEESPLTEIGLRPDDIVLEINGVPLNSVSTLLGLYVKLRSANRIEVRLKRSGTALQLSYVLK